MNEGHGDDAGSFTVAIQRPTGNIVVHLVGEVDTAAMHLTVAEALRRLPPRLAVDLSQVTSVDAAGIAALVSLAGSAVTSHIPFCLIGVQGGPVEHALLAAEVRELFEVFPSVNAAWAN